jgi:hypothetical protein
MVGGIGSATTSSSYEVSYDNNEYRINDKPSTEAEVNKLLAMQGITAAHGAFTTVDGMTLSSSANTSAVTDFGGPTPLPDVSGQGLGPTELQQKMWSDEITDGALMWEAISEMARVSQREMTDAKELRNAMQQGKIESKQAQINATEKQIEAERKAAGEALVGAIVSAVVTMAASIGGGALSGGEGAGKIIGGGLSSAAGSLGTVAQKAFDYMSKTSGGLREADDQKLVAKRYERQEAVFDAAVDEAKSSYEEAKEQFKLALRVLQEHMERQTQVVQKITS